MAHSSSDRNLLFGILALQMDFISRDQLVAAMHAWLLDKSKPLGVILEAQGVLSAARHQLLAPLVEEHIKQHGNNPQQSLAALSSVASVKQELEQLADPDLSQSLATVDFAPRTGAAALLSPAGVSADRRAALTDPEATEPPLKVTGAGSRFRIIRPHAKGGLGQVSVAVDEELQREVTLKEIQERYADSSDARARFLLEGEITGKLEHPGIVPVYGLGQYADGRPFYAMRFIAGDSLKDAIERFHATDRKPQSESERALEFRKLLGRFLDVCNAIAYAHSRGVLHRDLKPGNIMLGQYGETLVVDWGLAKVLGQQEVESTIPAHPVEVVAGSGATPTEMGRALGTPAYMSPEQAAGRLDQLGPASDVYSLGATLYCLLTGHAPFERNDQGDILARVQKGDFPRPRQVNATVPAALEAVCLKAMAVRPEDRYARVRALAEDLERWLADDPVSAWPEPWTVKARRWVGRHRPLVTGAAAAVFAALVLSVIMVVNLREAAQKDRERLFESLVSQAHSERRLGNRQRSLELLAEAARIRPAERLRKEAIQTIASSGVRFLSENPPRDGRRDGPPKDQSRYGPVFSADGNVTAFITGEYDDGKPVLHVREFHSGKFLAKRSDLITPLRFRPKTAHLAITKDQQSKECYLWDPIAGKDLGKFAGNNPVFSSDGVWMATTTGKDVHVWNLAQGVKAQGRPQGVPLHFLMNGRLLLLMADGDYVLWSVALGQKEPADTPRGLRCLGVSANGEFAAVYGSFLEVRDSVMVIRLIDQSISVLPDPGFIPNTASFSADGKQVALEDSSAKKLTIVVVDLPSKTIVSRMSLRGLEPSSKGYWSEEHSWGYPAPAFSPDGAMLAARGVRGGRYVLCLWDVETGAEIKALPQIIYFWWKEHGKILLTLGASIDEKNYFVGKGNPDGSFYLPDEKGKTPPYLPSGHVNLWEVTYPTPTYLHDGGIQSCGFKEDGSRLAVNDVVWEVNKHAEQYYLRRSDLATQGLSPVFRDPDEVWSAGSTLGNRAYATIWQLAPKKQKLEFPRPAFPEVDKQISTGLRKPWVHGTDFRVSVTAFSPNSKQVLIASYFALYGAKATPSHLTACPLELWDISPVQLVKRWNQANYASEDDPNGADWFRLQFSPDGKRVAASGRHGLTIWDVAQGKIDLTLVDIKSRQPSHQFRSATVDQLAFSRDGKHILAVASGRSPRERLIENDSMRSWATLFDVETGAELRSWEAHVGQGGWVSSALSPDGRWVTSGGEDGLIRLWDVATGLELAHWAGHETGVSALVFHPDGKTLVSGSKDGTLKLWNLPFIRKELAILGLDWDSK